MKALGAMNTGQPLPGSLDFMQCKDGQDTILEDYKKVAGWKHPEVLEIIRRSRNCDSDKGNPRYSGS